MNNAISRDQALKVLEINEQNPSEETIIKQYRTLALRYHPDKPSGSTESFQRLTEAYDILREERQSTENNPMKSFVSYIFENYKSNKLILSIIEKIILYCEEKSIALLEKIDRSLLYKIREIIELHREIFTVSERFLDALQEIINKKSVVGEHIILNPFLEDLFEERIYKMTIESSLLLIPLWHHQLIYDHPTIKSQEIVVECFPILPDNITIDSHNNIHCFVIQNLCDIFYMGSCTIDIGGRSFTIYSGDLRLIEEQDYIIKNSGISKINTGDMYDCGKKSDIYIHLRLILPR